MNGVGSGPGAVTWVRSKVRLRKKHYKGLQPGWRSEGTDVLHRFFKWQKIWNIIRRTRGGFKEGRKCFGHRVVGQRRDKSAILRRNENRIPFSFFICKSVNVAKRKAVKYSVYLILQDFLVAVRNKNYISSCL